MANRAYLFPTDDPNCWDPDRESGDSVYYDSRHTIPLAWWFLFNPEDVRTIEIGPTKVGSITLKGHSELRLRCERQTALSRLADRHDALEQVVRGRVDKRVLKFFRAILDEWSGRYLVMNPEEPLWVWPEDTQEHFGAFKKLIATLASPTPDLESLSKLSSNYSSMDSHVIADIKTAVVGCAYGERASVLWKKMVGA